MRILIYESSSRGGNFEYALALFKAYTANEKFSSVELVLPSLSKFSGEGVKNILVHDSEIRSRWLTKFWFLYRAFVNPFVLFFYLIGKEKRLVLFNDFEQSSAPIWTVFFKAFLSIHRYAVFLHDPDRDQYPPFPGYSRFSMTSLMNLMSLGLYHDHLPEKSYYQNKWTTYISVPHGIYPLPSGNKLLRQRILAFKEDRYLFAILGNIRLEKNYLMAIHALKSFPNAGLIIAGQPANGNVDIEIFRNEAIKLGVNDQIFWWIKYLDESELSTLISATDCVLLNYASSFVSQSGIINMIAPFKKQIIVSDTNSAFTKLVKRFNLGAIIEADKEHALTVAMEEKLQGSVQDVGWDEFIKYASWENQVKIVAEAYEQL